MKKTKLTRGEMASSITLFVFGAIIFAALMLLMLFARKGMQTISFIISDSDNIIMIGISIIVVFTMIYFFLFSENKEVLARPSKTIEYFLMLYVSFCICTLMDIYVNAMARPLLLFALLAGKLYKKRVAIFMNTSFAFLLVFNRYITLLEEQAAGIFMGGFQVELMIRLLTVFGGGIVAIFMIQRVKTRLGSVLVTFVLFIPVLVINISMEFPYIDGNYLYNYLNIILYSVVDCVLSVLLFMFILPIFELIFAEVTSFRLRELTSDSAKLLKKLKENAYGTYNHSVVVAQLAESCASAIGEDSELARAVAYYHDIGKLKNPEMFTENQSDYDLHTELTPELSVDIIRSHARDGAKLIKKYHLPEIFADIAVQHHGTMPIKYFYAKALKLSDGTLNTANYSYSGPTPATKIAAIIMICDAAEAATRSLSNRSAENIQALVNSLIEERMNMDQFADCDITMRELTVISGTIVNVLSGVYHSRTAYPKLTLSKNSQPKL